MEKALLPVGMGKHTESHSNNKNHKLAKDEFWPTKYLMYCTGWMSLN